MKHTLKQRLSYSHHPSHSPPSPNGLRRGKRSTRSGKRTKENRLLRPQRSQTCGRYFSMRTSQLVRFTAGRCVRVARLLHNTTASLYDEHFWLWLASWEFIVLLFLRVCSPFSMSNQALLLLQALPRLSFHAVFWIRYSTLVYQSCLLNFETHKLESGTSHAPNTHVHIKA